MGDDLKPLTGDEFKKAQETLKLLAGILDDLDGLSATVVTEVVIRPDETVYPLRTRLLTMIATIKQKVSSLQVGDKGVTL